MAAADQEAAVRKPLLATQRGFSFGVRLVKGFRWMEDFFNLGFLRGSSADMTTIPFLKVKNDHRSKFSNLSNWKEEA